MSIVKLTEDKFEYFTLVTNPSREFSSSSVGIIGDVKLFSRTNRTLKETVSYLSSSHFDETVGVAGPLKTFQLKAEETTNIYDAATNYIDAVSNEDLSLRNDKFVTITRSEPGFEISKNFQKKRVIKEILMPYYRAIYPSSNYGYCNYHCLNFFTASSVPTGSAIIYPVSYSGNTPTTYVPTSAFTLDFYINPRYASSASIAFKAGTILHVSSTLALSLVTGSSVDENNMKIGYRLLLQLSSSADIPPSEMSLTGTNNNRPTPYNFVFTSNDNCLKYNTWHHVAIRWGTSLTNHGTGSFFVDAQNVGNFCIPSSSIATFNRNAAALFLGNFFEGGAGVDESCFFNANSKLADGVTQLTTASNDPADNQGSVLFPKIHEMHLRHPLNAEIHDIKIFDTFRTLQQIVTSSQQGTTNTPDMIFYVPCFFVKESRSRNVLDTPFYQSRIQTDTPLNANLSFSVNGHNVNVENFTREFINNEYPRLYMLTSSIYTGAVITNSTANDYLFKNAATNKRNLTVLPCDNGKFTPNFDLLLSGTIKKSPDIDSPTYKFTTDQGGLNLQIITLRNMLDENLLLSAVSGGLESQVFGASPTDVANVVGSVPSTFQKTRDSSSNEVVIFDVSNLYYGRRILPNTLSIVDSNVSGSTGLINVTLKDDGHGGIYRADSLSKHAKWNAIGTVFYNEGLIIIKSPHIPFFGKDQYSMTFKGERNIYVSKISVIAQSGLVNSSSNPSFIDTAVSSNANDNDQSFVYITGISLHDDNLNVIARTNFAQPIVKRSSEKIMIKIKTDW